MADSESLRKLPQVDKLLLAPATARLIEKYGRDQVTKAFRAVIDEKRSNILSGADTEEWDIPRWTEAAALRLVKLFKPRLHRVMNCSGVVVHTNLGRAQMAEEAAHAAHIAATSNVNLEYRMDEGARGDRDEIVEDLILTLTGAEAATVVNNNAAAVLLALNTLSDRRETIVSRGELIEIGGSFRLPEIMSKSGCVLREIGTTNRTHMRDYEEAVTENTALILRAHASNYRIIGFTSQPALRELSTFARSKNLPLMVDLGAGAILDMRDYGLPYEPTVRHTLEEGADVVTISGDKLLGGPQAGIIVGNKRIIDKIRKNHLKRALRCCKMTLAALETTLRLYLHPEKAVKQIPVLRYLTRSLDDIRATAAQVVEILSGWFHDDAEIFIIDDISRAGSGALPEIDIPSVSVAIRHKKMKPDELAAWFRNLDTPVVGRVEKDLFRLDMRCMTDISHYLE